MRIFPLLGWMLFPGCWAAVQVWGPRTVQGPLGGSVTVRCTYEPGYKTYHKYWCRGGSGLWSCSSDHLAKSDGTEAEAKWGRVSIQDNQTQRIFTVTVENLTRADTGTYRCGVKRAAALRDLTDTVTVLVSPDDPSPSPTGRTPSTPEQPESPSPPPSTATLTSAEKGDSSSRTNQDTTAHGRSMDPDPILYIVIPCVLLVLILFLLAAIVLVRVTKKRKKGASVKRDKKIKLSNLGVENNAVDGRPEYNLEESPIATAQTELYANAAILPNSMNPESRYKEIQPHHQDTAGTEEVSYVTLTISTPDQQPIYGNMEQHPKAVHPANPSNQVLYSSVQKSKH